MIAVDVNLLVYSFRIDSPHHARARAWLESMKRGDEELALADAVWAGFVRIATNLKVYASPTPTSDALATIQSLRSATMTVLIGPGPEHWRIFNELCSAMNATGNDIPDAYLAALAIEHQCELATTDRGFARFPGLRWRNPLDN